MIRPILLSSIFALLLPFAQAGSLAILAPDQIISVDGPLKSDSPKSPFLSAFSAFVTNGATPDNSLPLVNPPEWGKTLSAHTHGTIEYKNAFPGGFAGTLTLSGLEPHKNYRLTLNGKPGLDGNELLPTPVPGLPNEFFYDFLDIVSDENGAYQATLGIKLKPGDYHVRIYVKDTEDWMIVLYRDYFRFSVEKP